MCRRFGFWVILPFFYTAAISTSSPGQKSSLYAILPKLFPIFSRACHSGKWSLQLEISIQSRVNIFGYVHSSYQILRKLFTPWNKWPLSVVQWTFLYNHPKLQLSRPICLATRALSVRGTIFGRGLREPKWPSSWYRCSETRWDIGKLMKICRLTCLKSNICSNQGDPRTLVP